MINSQSYSFLSTKSGGVLAIGQPAHELWDLFHEIETLWRSWEAEFLWLSPLRVRRGKTSKEHPQQVRSYHTNSILPHAACLPLFDELEDSRSQVYVGIGTVHRLEPMRAIDIGGRLESFHVAETVIVGDENFCKAKYRRIHDDIGQFLEGYVKGTWKVMSDTFVDEIQQKEEWIAGSGPQALAIASANDHGTYFLEQRKLPGQSMCFGIGIERLYEAIQRFA